MLQTTKNCGAAIKKNADTESEIYTEEKVNYMKNNPFNRRRRTSIKKKRCRKEKGVRFHTNKGSKLGSKTPQVLGGKIRSRLGGITTNTEGASALR